MTNMPILDKDQFSNYAKALLKNHHVIFSDGRSSVKFAENSPSELLADSVFSYERTQIVVYRKNILLGGLIFQKNRCLTKDCQVVELISAAGEAKELTPNHLAH